MKISRIYTEYKNQVWIINTVAKYVDGATFYQGVGLWQGQREIALIVEFHDCPDDIVRGIAKKIQTHNKQDCVRIVIEYGARCIDIM